MRSRPRAVFVPYELKDGLWHRCNDLPRFVEPHLVIEFLGKNLSKSPRKLDWREEFDDTSINEYMLEVGENILPLIRRN